MAERLLALDQRERAREKSPFEASWGRLLLLRLWSALEHNLSSCSSGRLSAFCLDSFTRRRKESR